MEVHGNARTAALLFLLGHQSISACKILLNEFVLQARETLSSCPVLVYIHSRLSGLNLHAYGLDGLTACTS